ncbi:hypothetical protein [Armatimonas sp.]|uniref:hypothetical protein n=1 Tax=Armatimonas sp. TaxID=1872638 RepID=UPI00286A60E1|nr:hypothetical protein [Armatimonas sp.]
MTTDNKNAAVVLGGIVGAIGLTALTMEYHEYLWPGIGGDGQYGMVLFPTATWGGLFYGAASAVMYLHHMKNPVLICKALTLVGLSPSSFWTLIWPTGGALFCLPSLLVGLLMLVYLESTNIKKRSLGKRE